MTTIYVASTSFEKINAAKNGWLALYPNTSVIVVPLTDANDAPSGVPEQPLNDEISRGAHNRLNALEKKLGEHLRDGDYLIAFESGIWVDLSDPTGQIAEEGTICVAKKVNGQTASSKSVCRRYPYHIVTQARKEGITTLKEHNKLVSAWYKQNPVVGQSREQVMIDVCVQTLAKL